MMTLGLLGRGSRPASPVAHLSGEAASGAGEAPVLQPPTTIIARGIVVSRHALRTCHVSAAGPPTTSDDDRAATIAAPTPLRQLPGARLPGPRPCRERDRETVVRDDLPSGSLRFSSLSYADK